MLRFQQNTLLILLGKFLFLIPPLSFLGFLLAYSSTLHDGFAPYLIVFQGLWIFYLLIIFIVGSSKFLALFWGVFTLYGSSSWVAYYYYGYLYPPFPSSATILSGSILSLQATVFAFIVTNMIFINVSWDAWFRKSVDAMLLRVYHASNIWTIISSLSMLFLAILTWYQIFQFGVINILSHDRRFFSSALIVSDHNLKILYMPFSFFLLCLLIVKQMKYKTTLLFIFFIFWLPIVLIGGRHDLVTILFMLFLTIFYSSDMFISKTKRDALTRVFLPVIFFTLLSLALIWTSNPIASLHEFILPQYIIYAALEGRFSFSYNFFQGFWFLFPAFLRPVTVISLGELVTQSGLSSVGYGGNPIAEAYISNPNMTILFFCMTTLLLLGVIYWAVKTNLGYASFIGAFLFLWGRSDFWILIWYILYCSITFKIITIRFKSGIFEFLKTYIFVDKLKS